MSDQAIGGATAGGSWGPDVATAARRLVRLLASSPSTVRCGAEARSAAWIARGAWAALVCLFVVGGAPHVPWFDEAQAWLIARDASPWEMVGRIGRYEGTPMLWHLVLWSLQRIGYPFLGLWLVSSAFAAAGAWVTLNRAPFPLWLRIGLVFAYFPAFQFAVVARSYALDLLAFPLIAAGYGRRLERPVLYALLLGLTANTNAFAFLFALVFAADLAWGLRARLLAGERRAWAAALVFCVLALAAALQARPAADVTFSGPPTALGWAKAPILFKEALFSRLDVLSLDPPSAIAHLGGLVASGVLAALVVMLVMAARKLPLFAGGVAVFVLFAVLAYGSLWHAGVLFLFIVAMTWIAWEDRAAMAPLARRALSAGLAVFVLASACETGLAYARDARAPYSSSAATARWIAAFRAAHPNARLAALGYGALNVEPFFARDVYGDGASPGRPAYYLWSRRNPMRPHPTLADVRATLTDARPDAVVMAAPPSKMAALVTEARRDGYCPVARFHGAMAWKSYVVQDDADWVFRPCGAAP